MNLYLVRNAAGTPVWIAHEDNEQRIWTYVQNTGKFHLNQGLYRDFYFEHANTYAPISADDALQQIRSGIGKLDEQTVGHLVERFKQDPAAQTVEDVLGSSPVPTARQQAEARVNALVQAPRGKWMTWKSYRLAEKQLAHVSARDLRLGRIKIVNTKVGAVESRLEEDGENVNVMVARAANG